MNSPELNREDAANITSQQLLVLMAGVPGAGKTYFAKQLAAQIGAVRLNADGMRTALFGSVNAGRPPEKKALVYDALLYATKQILDAGVSVIFDSQHSSIEDRDRRRAAATDSGSLSVLVLVKTPATTALERGLERTSSAEHLIVDASEMQAIIERSERIQEAAVATENLIEIDGLQPFEQQYGSFQAQLATKIL